MSITVSGLGSGLDYASWIEKLVAIKQGKIDAVSAQASSINSKKGALSTVEDRYTNLLTAIKKFTAVLSTEDVFNKKTASSSDTDAITASVTHKATAQNVSVSVSQLATSTVAKSASVAASYITGETTLDSISGGSFKAGKFSVYVDGTKNEITLNADEDLNSVLGKLNAITGVNATLNEQGKLTIGADAEENVTIGATSDTSNFTNLMALTRDTDTGEYSSSKSIFKTDSNTALISTSFAGGTVTTGDFTIGNETFTINSSTTLNSLIKQINSSDAGVTAAWDSNAGKMVLTAKDEGAVNINIEAGTSNFTDIMKLTSDDALAVGSQTLGTNAVLTINGTQITSTSNTVTSDISGIEGLTLTLKDETTSAKTVSIAQDTKTITDAITSLVSSYNMAISDTDTALGANGNLHGETILKSLRNNIRNMITSAITGNGDYNTLASIGITTGAFSTNTSADTTQLKINAEALKSALEADPDAVKKLLVGDKITGGVLNNIEKAIENVTNPVNGYFTTREKAYDKEAGRLNTKVEKMTRALERYQDQLEAKFEAMDKLISALQNQASIFDSYFNNDNNNKNK